MSIWALLYFVPLVYLTGFAFGKKDKDFKIITSISVVAFIFTRLISEFVEGDRYMLDMANDLMVVAVMVLFISLRPVVLLLIASYGCMTFFSYLPYLEGFITKQDNYVILEIIGKLQLLIIFGGLNGYIRSAWNRYIVPTWVRAYTYLARRYNKLVIVFDNDSRASSIRVDIPDENRANSPSDIPFKSGLHAHLAKDN